MEIVGRLQSGRFIERPNRFLAYVKCGTRTMAAFVPSPGRMNELLIPGAKVLLRRVQDRERKTHFDLLGVYQRNKLVLIDSRIPNLLVRELLAEGKLSEFSIYSSFKPEPKFGQSRLDFELRNGGGKCLLELKSVTLVIDKVALFPDAPTERGARHLAALSRAVEMGFDASVLFLVQRTDAIKFKPNQETDPKFAERLREAAKNGVRIYSYTCGLSGKQIKLGQRIPVSLFESAGR